MTDDLPTSVPVSAADWFLTAFDRAMRRSTGSGNVCHLVMELDGPMSADALRAGHASLLDWMASLRMERPRWLSVPVWVVRGPQALSIREQEAGDDVPLGDLLTETCSVFDDAPLWVELVHRPDGATTVVLSWHHAMMDAQGAEAAALVLAGAPPAPTQALAVPAPPPPSGWVTRLLQARLARNFVFLISLGRVATVGRLAGRHGARSRYLRLALSPEETSTSDAVALASGAGIFRSLFYLAAVSRALDEILAARGGPVRDFLVPVPQNRRRRGVVAPALTNQLGVLFYRLRPSDRRTTAATVSALTTQLKALMMVKMPEALQVLLEMCRYLPLWALWGVMSLPSGGRVATLGFSDTGDTLDRLTDFLGRGVRRAWHVPANIHPPGFQVVVSRRGGSVEVCTSYVEGMLTTDELERYQERLREILLVAEGEG